jgi:septum formation topological specificity factor MinE
VTYGWVHRAAHILNNDDQRSEAAVKQRLHGLLGAMKRHRTTPGTLAPAVDHFLKVSHSYWSGLFHCYSVPDLPRTNNDLEQFFGAHRYHERRATGRKGASPALVLRGSVQLVAYAATRLRPFTGEELAPDQTQSWQELRQRLETRRQQRTHRRRFRRAPASYLAQLEADLLQLILPS